MPDSELLSAAEIRDLTGCVAREAQRAKLAELGVPFRPDGARILVSRYHARQWLAGAEWANLSGDVRLDLVR